MTTIQNWWTYAIKELMGYRRPSPVTPYDVQLRHEAEETSERLLDGLVVLKKRVRALTPIAPDQEW